MKQFSVRKAIKILNDAGFRFLRQGKGSHSIYIRDNQTITIPTSGSEINCMMFKRLCKENNISIA